jgi:N-carbamoylputrescine amidase
MVWQHTLHDHAITPRGQRMKSTSPLRVAVLQQSCTNNREHNLASTMHAIEQAAKQGAKVVVLQELHTNLYFCQTENADLFDLAETIPGPTTKLLGELARKLAIVIVASLFEKRAVGLYHNTAVVIEKTGDIAGCYRKMHIPDDPGYYEKFYFTPGDLGFKPIATSVATLGVLVCWDQWYPEAARLMALAGADVLIYPTAIGWGSQEKDANEMQRQRQAWQLVQRAHAVANGLPVLVANRTGFEPVSSESSQGIAFWGSSFITGPQGEILAEASQDKPETLIADIDLHRNEHVRRGWPFLRDRRIDHYQGIVQRYLD